MRTEITSQSVAQTSGGAFTFWTRFRATFGPAVVGLVGGTLTVGIAFVSLTTILRSCSDTYAKFPSVRTPWLAGDFTLPVVACIPVVLLAFVSPFAMGLVTAHLVRPKDRWEAVSAGLTTAATSSATAYLLWIGWMVTVAMVIVPSVSDMNLFANSTKLPAEATAHPSDVLLAPYPDLKATQADERGASFFAKIVSDQVVGSAHGIWCGVAMSVATVGLPGLCGTLAGTWLLRRRGAWWSKLFAYLELTVATAVPLGLFLFFVGSPGGFVEPPMTWFQFVSLIAVSAVVFAGGVAGWNWPLRLVAAFAWVMTLTGVGFRDSTSLAAVMAIVVGYGGLAFLLVRQLLLRWNAQEPSATRLVIPA